MKSVMTIAGSDSSGGAGIEADIKTIAAHKLFATCAITALTAQNTTGVYGTEGVAPEFVSKQIDVVFDDIRPDAVKIGMVSSAEIVQAIAEPLLENHAERIVVDPVMVATSGSALIENGSIEALKTLLFPIASVITPNIPEAEVLADMEIRKPEDMIEAAYSIREDILRTSQAGTDGSMHVPAIMLKGGHAVCADGEANDLVLSSGGEIDWLYGVRVDTQNTHGTGCTLSSAIACELASGKNAVEACRAAKEYVHGAIASGLDLGSGTGPIDHMWQYR